VPPVAQRMDDRQDADDHTAHRAPHWGATGRRPRDRTRRRASCGGSVRRGARGGLCSAVRRGAQFVDRPLAAEEPQPPEEPAGTRAPAESTSRTRLARTRGARGVGAASRRLCQPPPRWPRRTTSGDCHRHGPVPDPPGDRAPRKHRVRAVMVTPRHPRGRCAPRAAFASQVVGRAPAPGSDSSRARNGRAPPPARQIPVPPEPGSLGMQPLL
jgi:hypothetical protein